MMKKTKSSRPAPCPALRTRTHPIPSCATYHHLECFAALLLYGAKPGLSELEFDALPSTVITQCSVPHALIKYR